MSRRPTQRRHSSWERITIHPRRDREKIDALKGDMVRAFMKGDLETYWKLDRELRWILPRENLGECACGADAPPAIIFGDLIGKLACPERVWP